MLAAVQSTEMSEEHQHDRPVAPEITQPVWFSGAVDERRLGERGEIHTGEPIYSSPRALIGRAMPIEGIDVPLNLPSRSSEERRAGEVAGLEQLDGRRPIGECGTDRREVGRHREAG
jgi:hypothetical protein